MAGWLAGALALMSAAGHRSTDTLSRGVALIAASIALRPPSARMSYGYSRVEVLAALFNAGFMVAVILLIGWNAIERLRTPQSVDGDTVIWIGALGLAVNLLVAWILSRSGDHEHNLNTRGALLHVMGDALGSVAALASGLIGVHGETAHAAGYGASAAGEEIRLRLPLTVEHAAIKAAPGHRQQENNTQGDLQRTIHCLLAPLKIGAR